MRESFTAFFNDAPLILMEGALGERLKREYRIPFHPALAMADLQTASPQALAADMLRLKNETDIKLFGGCCGTDARHLDAIAAAMQPNSDRKDGYEI